MDACRRQSLLPLPLPLPVAGNLVRLVAVVVDSLPAFWLGFGWLVGGWAVAGVGCEQQQQSVSWKHPRLSMGNRDGGKVRIYFGNKK